MRELAQALLAFAVATAVGSSRAADFKTGDMVDKETWQKATGLLPPEVLKHYEKGEYANKFVDWPADKLGQAPDFKAGTDANTDRFTLHQVLSWNPIPFTRPNGKVDYNEGSNQAYQCIENLKLNRATPTSSSIPPSSTRAPSRDQGNST